MSERLNVLLEFYRDNDRMIETVERVNDSYLEMLDALEVLEDENAKLREQIVRCRDCKHYADHEWVIATDVSDVCHFWANGVKVEPDGFCKWGERRADA